MAVATPLLLNCIWQHNKESCGERWSRGIAFAFFFCCAGLSGDGGSIPPTAVSKLRQFCSPHICLCLSDTKSRWSLLSGVYARGSKRSHTGGKCVTCTGITNSRWTLNALQRAPSSIWEKEKERSSLKQLRPLWTIGFAIRCCIKWLLSEQIDNCYRLSTSEWQWMKR